MTPEEAWTEGHGTSGVGVWLRLRTTTQGSCAFRVRPSVVLDSGFGPDPAIDGTAQPDAPVVPGMLVPESKGLRLLLSWTSDCEPNHKAPIQRLLVGPEGDERVAIAAARLPASLKRFYCWNDGAELGTLAYS